MSNDTRIKNLYTYLIHNRLAEEEGWRKEYSHLRLQVDRVRASQLHGNRLTDKAPYENTDFSQHEAPWRALASRLIYETNGVTPIRQTTMGGDHFEVLIESETFCEALEKLVKNPDFLNFREFVEIWEQVRKSKPGHNANYARMHRTLAACTCDVTSTVNIGEFNQIFKWLVDEGFIEDPNIDGSWHERNKQVMDYLRRVFAGELANHDSAETQDAAPAPAEPGKMKTSEVLLSMFVYRLFENRSNPFTLKKQVVLYGAPGTGKTFAAKRDTELRFSIWQEQFDTAGRCRFEDHFEIVQFHPSFGYEDFVEGLRPEPDGNGKAQLKLKNGIFKRFCRRASQWEREINAISNLVNGWESLLIRDLLPHKNHLTGEHWKDILGYPDAAKKVADAVPPYFFVIDEINRAELSRVMGELMYSLEYRGVRGAIATQYAELNGADTGFIASGGIYKFFIPHNVFLIGTMNTIDRSVESFDLALRRRFRWERLVPDYTAIRYHLSENGQVAWLDLAKNLETLNHTIRENELLGEDYEIGHAYLMNLTYPAKLGIDEVRKTVWQDSISPLLEEYLRGSGRTKKLLPKFKNSFGIA